MTHLQENETHGQADINQSVLDSIETAKRIKNSPAQGVFGEAYADETGTVDAQYDTGRYMHDPGKSVRMTVDHEPANPSAETYVDVGYLNEKGGRIQYGATAKGDVDSMTGEAHVLRMIGSKEDPGVYTHAFTDKNKDRAASLVISLASKRINKQIDRLEKAREVASEDDA